MKKATANYMRILGNAEEEFVFLTEMVLEALRLNIENLEAKDRRKWARSAAKDILRICRKYLSDELPSNDD